jgi:hypothetical protein
MTDIAKLKNAQEERRARLEGMDPWHPNMDYPEILEELGLDVEVAESENSSSTPFYMLVEFDIDHDELPKGIDLDTMMNIAIETLDMQMPPSFVFEPLNVTYGDVDDFDSEGLLLTPGEGEHTFQLGPVQL